jgi:hypoxanthine phosphoribosyltransferase
MKKLYYSDSDIRAQVHEIIRSMQRDKWQPDYIVGLTRGGLVPANMISQYLDVTLHTLNVSFRDSDNIGPESNLWMAEDAFNGVNILIVDDINDSGRTLDWIQGDWISSCLPHDDRWDNVWGNNVRTAVLVNNEASAFKTVTYSGEQINKQEDPVWCVFPWEEWWR